MVPPSRFAGLLLLAVTMPAAAQPSPQTPDIEASDLHRGHAHYMAATGRPSAALVRLRMLDVARGALIARLYARAGMTDAATAALSGLENVHRADGAWLALAQARLERDAVAAARTALEATSTPLYREFGLRRASLLARVQLRQDQPADAVVTLAGERQRQKLPILDRYQLGIARLRAGETERGLGELEKLGLYVGDDPARKALADQANLTLGYWYLSRNRGAQARRVFLRVRLDRPLSRRALLGLGWAEISTGGITQALTMEGGPGCGTDPELFEEAQPLHKIPRPNCRLRDIDDDRRLLDAEALQNTEQSQYERAAVAWQTAARDGDPVNPVVAEARVANAYAQAGLGDEQAAVRKFKAVIDELEAVLSRPIRTDSQPKPGTPLAHLSTDLADVRKQLARRAASFNASASPIRDKPDALTKLIETLEETAGYQAVTQPFQRHGRLLVMLETLIPPPTAPVSTQRLQRLDERVRQTLDRYRTLRGALDRAGHAAARQRARKRRKQITTALRDARRGLAALTQSSQLP